MEVTNVSVRLKTDHERIKATASIVFDDCFVVNDVCVVNGKSGLFVAMPSRELRAGNGYRDIAHPINVECRSKVHDAVMKEYEKELAKAEKVDAETE